MSDKTTIISAVTAFLIAAGGTIMVVVAANGAAALNKTAWALSVMVGLTSAAKDLRSSFRMPPVDVGAGAKPPGA
jgi:hypothetical protein